MIAVQFDAPGPSSVLHLVERATPAVSGNSVLVYVKAAGISPVDFALRSGASQLASSLTLPHVIGIDAAGIVVGLGDGVTNAQLGDELFGSVALTAFGGATAEYAVLAQWGAKPTAWSWAEAGVAGSSVETATRALDLLNVFPGANVIVEGAAGGVGSIMAQLAVARGANVFGTARAESLHVVASLPGVTAVLAGEDWSLTLRAAGIDRVDAALDASGAGVLAALVAATGDPALVVTIADVSAAEYAVRLTRGALAGEQTGYHGLRTAAELSRRGLLTMPLRGSFPFSRASEAHDVAESRPRWGKVALVNDQS